MDNGIIDAENGIVRAEVQGEIQVRLYHPCTWGDIPDWPKIVEHKYDNPPYSRCLPDSRERGPVLTELGATSDEYIFPEPGQSWIVRWPDGTFEHIHSDRFYALFAPNAKQDMQRNLDLVLGFVGKMQAAAKEPNNG